MFLCWFFLRECGFSCRTFSIHHFTFLMRWQRSRFSTHSLSVGLGSPVKIYRRRQWQSTLVIKGRMRSWRLINTFELFSILAWWGDGVGLAMAAGLLLVLLWTNFRWEDLRWKTVFWVKSRRSIFAGRETISRWLHVEVLDSFYWIFIYFKMKSHEELDFSKNWENEMLWPRPI